MKARWKIIIVLIILIAILSVFGLVFDWGRRNSQEIITENQVYATSSEIVIYTPQNNESVNSPVYISGKAKGNWFFEAVFPIKLYDENENIIGFGQAQAQGDWMTQDFVNFTAQITYDRSTSTDSGLLVFENDNPSGNPDFLKRYTMPVKLK